MAPKCQTSTADNKNGKKKRATQPRHEDPSSDFSELSSVSSVSSPPSSQPENDPPSEIAHSSDSEANLDNLNSSMDQKNIVDGSSVIVLDGPLHILKSSTITHSVDRAKAAVSTVHSSGAETNETALNPAGPPAVTTTLISSTTVDTSVLTTAVPTTAVPTTAVPTTPQQPLTDATFSNSLITVTSHPHLPEQVADRLNRFACYMNITTACYAISRLPDEATWGNVAYGAADKSEYLTINNVPVILWIVGNVVFPNLFKNGSPTRKPGFLLRPVADEDFRKATNILSTRSSPAYNYHADDGIWVSRWMGRKSLPIQHIKAFDKIYDATETFRRKNEMIKISASDVFVGDTMLFECSVTHWPVLTEEERHEQESQQHQYGQYRKSRMWKNWRCDFKLEAASLLYRGAAADDERLLDVGIVM